MPHHPEPEGWRTLNRALWDERVPIHFHMPVGMPALPLMYSLRASRG